MFVHFTAVCRKTKLLNIKPCIVGHKYNGSRAYFFMDDLPKVI